MKTKQKKSAVLACLIAGVFAAFSVSAKSDLSDLGNSVQQYADRAEASPRHMVPNLLGIGHHGTLQIADGYFVVCSESKSSTCLRVGDKPWANELTLKFGHSKVDGSLALQLLVEENLSKEASGQLQRQFIVDFTRALIGVDALSKGVPLPGAIQAMSAINEDAVKVPSPDLAKDEQMEEIIVVGRRDQAISAGIALMGLISSLRNSFKPNYTEGREVTACKNLLSQALGLCLNQLQSDTTKCMQLSGRQNQADCLTNANAKAQLCKDLALSNQCA